MLGKEQARGCPPPEGAWLSELQKQFALELGPAHLSSIVSWEETERLPYTILALPY